ncbi:MucR family transcriptional regulator [Geodermatophilus sp. DF01-2]|uniref:MucR family transcriptional regulator n=1 Tax=Geodermatophilus sp. DF01-2 TaxID=2559610 RepID=UPI001073A3E7|nr:MucR family transcriptional regulator [Geodermatophilus sp. DF01_2]TFV61844.1 MucR family transcriptional regulator [Geodermatophilus sp. DF01_2]
MLHPVGPLPAAVYWRRRLLVLALLLAVLGGGGWLALAAVTGGAEGTTATAATTGPTDAPAEPPALEQVVPSLASVRTPTPAPEPAPRPAPEPAGPAPGGPCTDDMVGLEVRAPGSAPVGGKPTFELVVTNVSQVPCVRVLDKGLQEIVMLDPAGNRVWGSNDCFPEDSSDIRTLAPGESVAFPLVWSGLVSEPTCTAPRTKPAPGQYALRGRLDTKTSPDAPFTIG